MRRRRLHRQFKHLAVAGKIVHTAVVAGLDHRAGVDGLVTGTVLLSAAAPTGGALVALSSSSVAVTVPANVTVPAGATSATFQVTAAANSTGQTANVVATYAGSSAAGLVDRDRGRGRTVASGAERHAFGEHGRGGRIGHRDRDIVGFGTRRRCVGNGVVEFGCGDGTLDRHGSGRGNLGDVPGHGLSERDRRSDGEHRCRVRWEFGPGVVDGDGDGEWGDATEVQHPQHHGPERDGKPA